MTSPHQPEDNSIDDMDPPVQEEIEEKIENDTFGQNEVTVNQVSVISNIFSNQNRFSSQ